MVQVEQECGTCEPHRTWNSQLMTGSIPSGNLLLSAAILFTGDFLIGKYIIFVRRYQTC